eukprot:jgi/Botrbrau1/5851/Bobra.0366s0032.1
MASSLYTFRIWNGCYSPVQHTLLELLLSCALQESFSSVLWHGKANRHMSLFGAYRTTWPLRALPYLY